MRCAPPILVALLLAACAGTPPVPSPGNGAPRAVDAASYRRSVSEHALAMVGVAYRYGGASPDGGFDCSGLVYYAYTMSGVSVPRTSQDQFRAARKIALSAAERGDIMFFQDQEKLSHVAIYVGAGRFVHAPASGRSVSVASIETPYYQRHLVGVGRLIPD